MFRRLSQGDAGRVMTVLDIGGLGLGTLSKDVLDVLRTTSEVRDACGCWWVWGVGSVDGWMGGRLCMHDTPPPRRLHPPPSPKHAKYNRL